MGAIPYDILLKLENDRKPLANISEENSDLKKLRQRLYDKSKENDKEIQKQYIANMLDEGYPLEEIAKAQCTNLRHIRKVIKLNKLEPHPRFKYLAFNKRSNQMIFSTSFVGYRWLVNCPNFTGTKLNLKHQGYELIRNRDLYSWKDVRPGDIYIVSGVKKVK